MGEGGRGFFRVPPAGRVPGAGRLTEALGVLLGVAVGLGVGVEVDLGLAVTPAVGEGLLPLASTSQADIGKRLHPTASRPRSKVLGARPGMRI